MDAEVAVSLALLAFVPAHSGSSVYRRPRALLGMRDLRKTARGASSPAKPALHMPELIACQFHPFRYRLLRAIVAAAIGRGWWSATDSPPPAESARSRGSAYPLSMTRAATSSIKQNAVSSYSRIHAKP